MLFVITSISTSPGIIDNGKIPFSVFVGYKYHADSSLLTVRAGRYVQYRDRHSYLSSRLTLIKFIKGPQGPWKPRRINGQWHWLTTIYRRERNIAVYPHQGYEFGDAGDFIIDSLKN